MGQDGADIPPTQWHLELSGVISGDDLRLRCVVVDATGLGGSLVAAVASAVLGIGQLAGVFAGLAPALLMTLLFLL